MVMLDAFRKSIPDSTESSCTFKKRRKTSCPNYGYRIATKMPAKLWLVPVWQRLDATVLPPSLEAQLDCLSLTPVEGAVCLLV